MEVENGKTWWDMQITLLEQSWYNTKQVVNSTSMMISGSLILLSAQLEIDEEFEYPACAA